MNEEGSWPADLETEEEALEIVRRNPAWSEPEWHRVTRFFSLLDAEQRWDFLNALGQDSLTEETLVKVGVYLMMICIERDGMACENQLRAGLGSRNFHRMLECSSPSDEEVREMINDMLAE